MQIVWKREIKLGLPLKQEVFLLKMQHIEQEVWNLAWNTEAWSLPEEWDFSNIASDT